MGAGPETAEEWSSVDVYMGSLERIYVLVEKRLLDPDTVQRMYRYRVGNLMAHEGIRDKIVSEKDYWQDYINLCRLVGVSIPELGF